MCSLCGSFLVFVFLCFTVLYFAAKNLIVLGDHQSVREELGFIGCETEIMCCLVLGNIPKVR